MAQTAPLTRGIILFAHGARDPRWAEPFERLAVRVRARTPGTEVRLAFLERMTPDLRSAAAELAAAGVGSIRIVPLFFGQGGHVRNDLPVLVDGLRQRHPEVAFSLAVAIGEDDAVLDALAEVCVRQLDRPET
jgi:sirohydrochlorin cobaltochelatase